MATAKKKAPAKKKAVRQEVDDRVIVIKTERVPTDDLQGYYKNPRIGDVDAIAISLDTHGQYRPILVNIGSKTGRKNEILAGNHTWLGARRELTYRDAEGNNCFKESWNSIYASFVDVDDETAAKIVLADNKLADRGEYADDILAELFESLPDITGTGYTKDEVDDIMSNLNIDTTEAMKGIDDFLKDMPEAEEDEGEVTPSQRRTLMENEPEEKKEAARQRGASRPELEEDKDIEEIDVSAELQVILELKEDNLYLGNNHWGIPEFRDDMLVTVDELPDPIQTWGGHESTPDDGSTWFLYNYGLGGRKGLPLDRTILSFFCQDAKFANWWELPAYYTARYVSEGVKYVIVPDYSFYMEEARAHHMYSQYKAQWLGRFFQEAGLKVIPRLQFDLKDRKHALDIGMLGLPRGAEVLSTSQQNMQGDEDEKEVAAILQEAIQELKPKVLLLYGGNPAKRVGDRLKGVEVRWVENYAAVRRATVFDKKDGAAKLSKKQKDALIEKHGGKKTLKRHDPDEDE